MKCLISYIIIFLLCFNAFAQNTNKTLVDKEDLTLNKHLISIMHRQYLERKKSLKEALKSVDALKNYQEACSKRYKNLFTDLHENIILPNADSISSITCENYRIDKLILNNEITTNLYIPNSKGLKPAILFFCGHEMTSKATESYQKTAILLAQHGFIVLVIDPRGQGERVEMLDEKGNNLTRGATTEHTLLNMGLGLSGWSTVQVELMENNWCLNYLCTRADVDKNKIGCMGNSGGGAQATYFSAMEPRIKAVACCSWFTQRERMLIANGPDDGCQYLWNEGREQLDIPDYYIMQAPRPMLILAGTKDFIDYQGTLDGFKEVKKVYSILGQANNAALVAYEDGHGISKPKREAAVLFFKKHLMQDSSLVNEGELKIQTEKLLACTAEGQVYVNRYNRVDINISSNQESIRKRKLFTLAKLDSNQVMVRKLLAIPHNLGGIKVKRLGKPIQTAQYNQQKYILQRKEEPALPVSILTPATWKLNPEVFIILHDSGMVASLKLPVIEKILQNGNAVILADPRGIGETKDEEGKNNKKFYSDDYRNAGLALFIGKPLLGQRVIDIFTVLDFISTEETLQGETINCFGYGNIGVAVMHASYLDNRINHIATKDCIKSWLDIIKHPTERNRMSLMLSNGLREYDINLLRKPTAY